MRDDAELVLTVGLRQFTLTESNQAVGATFSAEVRFAADLVDPRSGGRWSGSSFGDASRYGKKFSNTNCNEVLSDALLEAWSSLLNHGALRDTWAGNATPREVTGDAVSVSAAVLLEEVKALMEQGFESQTIIDYVSQQTLNAKLHSDDLLDWKAHQSLRSYLLQEMHEQYDLRRLAIAKALESKENMQAYRDESRKRYLVLLGEFPEKTPLNPQISQTKRFKNFWKKC